MRVMCITKVIDKKKTTEKQMNMLRCKEIVNELAKANGVRWYEYMLRIDDHSVLRFALDFEVSGKRRQQEQRGPGKSKRRRR